MTLDAFDLLDIGYDQDGLIDPTQEFALLEDRCNAILTAVRMAANPDDERQLDRRWNLQEAAFLVGRHPNRLQPAIDKLSAEGVWPPFASDATPGVKYELKHIRALQQHFGTAPVRDREREEPITVAVSAFKGGVGKTSVALHLAQYLSIRGYRVLLVDMDAQASCTAAFGYVPDLQIDAEHTLAPYMDGEERTLKYAIRNTHFPGLDLIPSCMRLFDTEWDLAMTMAREQEKVEKILNLTRDGIATVKGDYDIVIIDSPPSLGMLTSNLLRAADAVVVPTPPRMYDFSSAKQFFGLCSEVMESIRGGRGFLFNRMLATKMNRRAEEDNLLTLIKSEVPSRYWYSYPIRESADIGNAAQMYKTVIETRRPNKKTLRMLDLALGQIEVDILRGWRSSRMQARRTSLIAQLRDLEAELTPEIATEDAQ